MLYHVIYRPLTNFKIFIIFTKLSKPIHDNSNISITHQTTHIMVKLTQIDDESKTAFEQPESVEVPKTEPVEVAVNPTTQTPNLTLKTTLISKVKLFSTESLP